MIARVDGAGRCLDCGAAEGEEHDVGRHAERPSGKVLRLYDPIEPRFEPLIVAAPGTGGGPCGPLARDLRILDAAKSYVASITPGSDASIAERDRKHAVLFNAVHSSECEHERCQSMRLAAALDCGVCRKAIGYDEPYLVDGAQARHEACAISPSAHLRVVA